MSATPIRLVGENAALMRQILDWERRGWHKETEPDEIMVEGPAGTGKTRGILETIDYLWSKYPGVRVVFARKVKTDVNRSICVEWEDSVLGPAHPAVNDGRTRLGRSQYRHPNGSTVDLMGFDDPQRWRSMEFDILYVNEGTELTLEDWELACSRVRRWTIKFAQPKIMDTNPDSPVHWANLRPTEPHRIWGRPLMKRIVTRHEDNPKFWDSKAKKYTPEGEAYVLGTLEAMTGTRYLRFRKGLWVADEGLIYEEFDERRHVVEAGEIPTGFRYTFASMDFGWRDAGVLDIWGVDLSDRMWHLHQTYRTSLTTPQWAKKLRSSYDQYRLIGGVVPHDRPDSADLLRREGVPIIRCQTHSVAVGIDIVRERLTSRADGKPGVLFYRHALDERDEKLVAARKPTSTLGEFPAYVYPKAEDGKPLKEKPLEGLSDHGMDSLRYACVFVDRMGPKAFDGQRRSLDSEAKPPTESERREHLMRHGWQVDQ